MIWAGGHSQVDQAAVEGLALLDDVILLQELLEREALLVEHQLLGGEGEGGRGLLVPEARERWRDVATTGRARAWDVGKR